ncbi:ATP-binding protein [Adlercreutzia sp. ZJ141]|uniref:ATP-binding protein n=1 Tax=Adlercreutzia sp. ZJ141 TaxID=2709406 RepID=UPI001F14ED25|nr:AAA family ATPase [Adlercreutzia sp. ZJ141]
MQRYMTRQITSQLRAWKNSPFRKPLVLKGARQVGKTQVLKQFGIDEFANVAYVSLEKIDIDTPSEYAEFFEQTHDPRRIVANLTLALGVPIEVDSTLLILDEIQDCPAAINSLKYFCEEMPDLAVVCAGSLLGVALASENAFPVGKVSFLTMYPMTFTEFLWAVGEEPLAQYAGSISTFESIPQLFADRLRDNLRAYFAVGGMPEAVLRWATTSDIGQVDMVLSDLLDSYERDFAKHGGARMFAKISQVWRSLPAQLARDNKKFLYGIVREGSRAREYEDAVIWLQNAGLIYRVNRSTRPGLPLSAYDENAFKIYALDIGVLRRLSRLDATVFSRTENMFSEFKGAFAENYVLQALMTQLDVDPRYWVSEKPRHEVDYLVQLGNEVIPCEVKAGTNVKSPSLKYYAGKYPRETPLRVRFSLLNLARNDDVVNIPLYLCDHAAPLIRHSLFSA